MGAVTESSDWRARKRDETHHRIYETAMRLRGAEYGRTTAGQVVQALPSPGGGPLPPESIVAGAYLSAFTAALLAWADSNGERKLEDVLDEAFRTLQSN